MSTSTIFQFVHKPDSKYWFGFDVVKRVDYLTSQQRTRRRKRRTSDCFFFCSSSTYLRAPIWNLKWSAWTCARVDCAAEAVEVKRVGLNSRGRGNCAAR